jgi:leucyl aminopeptidase
MPPRFADPAEKAALTLHALSPAGLAAWRDAADPRHAAWAAACGFAARPGESCLLPDADGGLAGALYGLGDAPARFALAGAAARLPGGVWRLDGIDGGEARDEAALAWLLAGYRFARYRDQPLPAARLIAPDGVDAPQIEAIAAAEFLTRSLIDTPANDMGPDALEAAVRDLAARFGAAVAVTAGDALLAGNLPLIHAVGRAGAERPRLIDLTWGDPTHPALTLVGKGVCFDTGGLNLKPGDSMALMKKDMGGAATVLGLAQMLMATAAPVRLRVLIPAVENAVSGHAFRPGDILTARNGLTVEINNTDAEGRLVLADALALAAEDLPAALVCMATLTGAARVALGPDIAPFYTDDDGLAAALVAAAGQVRDPVWRMPFWAPYEAMLDPGIADLDNAPKGGMAGSVTAALFLRRFARDVPRFVHFDIYGWSPEGDAARPKGGVGQGARALFQALPALIA